MWRLAVEQSTEAQKLQVLVGELKENQSSFPAGVNVWSGKETGLVGGGWREVIGSNFLDSEPSCPIASA